MEINLYAEARIKFPENTNSQSCTDISAQALPLFNLSSDTQRIISRGPSHATISYIHPSSHDIIVFRFTGYKFRCRMSRDRETIQWQSGFAAVSARLL